jgi:nicotinamide-nucleotide amidase
MTTKRIEIITIGDEVLRGEIRENNAQFISRALIRAGLEPERIVVLPDDMDILVREFRDTAARGGAIIVTGGLGPTVDDITKEAVIRALGAATEFHREVVEAVAVRLRDRGREMPEGYKDQGRIPVGAEIIPNPVGLAIGLRIPGKSFEIYLLPGVPSEMKAMFEASVLPRLGAKGQDAFLRLRTFGLMETQVEDVLRTAIPPEILEKVSLISSPKGVDAYLPREAAGPAMIEAAGKALGSHLYARGDASLEETVVKLLIEKKLTVSTAESVTGGLLASTIVSVPGASDTFREGFVTYANEAKIARLGVSSQTLGEFGAVSPEVCAEMAAGARRAASADCALSTTGIAGPTGATAGKPIGLCFVGLASSVGLYVRKLQLMGDRDMVRLRAVYFALDMLRLSLAGEKASLEALRFEGRSAAGKKTKGRKA